MTMFERSNHGRANRTLFYDVNIILYVEGGSEQKGVMESFDGLFWRKVFSVMRPDLRIKILPRGSKTSLIEIADRLTDDGSDKSIVAMDRDYDGLFDRLIEKPGVIYTLGYSFENDIFCHENLAELFYSLCPVCDDNIDASQYVKILVDEYCRDVWWAQVADICGGIVARKVIDRDRSQKYIENNTYGNRPQLSKKALRADVKKANSLSPRPRVNGNPLRRNHLPLLSVGHLYATFCMKIIMHLHHLYSSTEKLRKDGIISNAITNFSSYILQTPESDHGIYYRNKLSSV